jgi:hypothetical protein
MKKIALIFSLIISTHISSAQLFIDIPSLDSSISYYKKSIFDINWQFRDPVFGAVFYCTDNDTIYWSITNLKNYLDLDWFKPLYYYSYNNEYVMIRVDSCSVRQFKKEIFNSVNDSSLRILQKALYPKDVLISGTMRSQIFYKTSSEKCTFLIYLEDEFPAKYYPVLPY